jgi:hypothetical protein
VTNRHVPPRTSNAVFVRHDWTRESRQQRHGLHVPSCSLRGLTQRAKSSATVPKRLREKGTEQEIEHVQSSQTRNKVFTNLAFSHTPHHSPVVTRPSEIYVDVSRCHPIKTDPPKQSHITSVRAIALAQLQAPLGAIRSHQLTSETLVLFVYLQFASYFPNPDLSLLH